MNSRKKTEKNGAKHDHSYVFIPKNEYEDVFKNHESKQENKEANVKQSQK